MATLTETPTGRLTPAETLIVIAHNIPTHRGSFHGTHDVNTFFRDRQEAFPSLLGYWKLPEGNSEECSTLTDAIARLRSQGALFLAEKFRGHYHFTSIAEQLYLEGVSRRILPAYQGLELVELSRQFDDVIAKDKVFKI